MYDQWINWLRNLADFKLTECSLLKNLILESTFQKGPPRSLRNLADFKWTECY